MYEIFFRKILFCNHCKSEANDNSLCNVGAVIINFNHKIENSTAENSLSYIKLHNAILNNIISLYDNKIAEIVNTVT